MVDKKDPEEGKKKTLSLSKSFEINKIVDAGQIRQSFSHGRSKTVSVEVKKKRTIDPVSQEKSEERSVVDVLMSEQRDKSPHNKLTASEIETRLKALQGAKRQEEAQKLLDLEKQKEILENEQRAQEERQEEDQERQRQADLLKEEQALPHTAKQSEEIPSAVSSAEEALSPEKKTASLVDASPRMTRPVFTGRVIDLDEETEDESRGRRGGGNVPKGAERRTLSVGKRTEHGDVRKQLHRLTVEDALEGAEQERIRSLASIKRARQKEKQKLGKDMGHEEAKKVIREVIIPDVITVQELSNRMAVRSADVIKTLIKFGVMATINQVLDADTAELVVTEFGHVVKKVSESDIEIGVGGGDDQEELKQSRAPVVTVMGHVDHGKTSLLDTIRKASVVSHEAGGITQHIGAYQVVLPSGKRITFIDTPGHAAFTQMRARGANVTDLVILVVAADDGVKEQTIEAINHARAAGVPIIVAINKIDKPDARPERVKTELLSHNIVVEEMGGDVMSVEISAKQNMNIDKLEEIILLQAEMLELKANPDRLAEGTVIESKVETGRGPVATLLVQKGTLKIGDCFVVGAEWGRVRALIGYDGKRCQEAGPSTPVEILGFNGLPVPGDVLQVIEDEAKARDVAEYRSHRTKQAKVMLGKKITLDQLMTQAAQNAQVKELALIVKSDVQGSVEAISASLMKIVSDHNEVSLRILHSGVGAITESDITLASTTNAYVVGFNVRANPQARELAARLGIHIRYYSIIYNILDDVKALLSGLLSPTVHERFLGNVQIREVFNITKVGKVAGCFVTEGIVKRGSSVRLLRDNVVIHEGKLRTLKRFKEEVKEVKEGYECGMAFESYHDMRVGDVIECFEFEEVARQL